MRLSAGALLLCSSVLCLELGNVSGFGASFPSIGSLSRSSCLREASKSPSRSSKAMATRRGMAGLVSALEPVPTLKTLLSTRSTVDEKEAIVKEMGSLRQSSSEDLEKLLDGMLAEVERELPAWSSIALPFPLPSYRSKLGTVKRMLAALLDGEDLPRRRRSAIFQLAKQLPSAKGVWGLEREVIRRTKKKLTMKDMLERTPADLETPKYDVVDQQDTWEVRNYEKFSVVSAQMESAFGPGTFNALAGYIFGGNKEGVKMAMTTPVINSGGKKMSFIMPSDFWEDTKSSPTPATSDVQVEAEGGGLIADSTLLAVEWFGGYATKEEVASRKKALVQSVEMSDSWQLLNPEDDPCLLQYNDPFVPPWKRRNEVAVAIKEKAQK